MIRIIIEAIIKFIIFSIIINIFAISLIITMLKLVQLLNKKLFNI